MKNRCRTHLFGVQRQQLLVGQVYHAERLVHLPHVDVANGQARPGERLQRAAVTMSLL